VYAAPPPYVVPADVARSVTVTALIADPGGNGRTLHCSWRSCPSPDSTTHWCTDPATTTFLADGDCADGEVAFAFDVPVAAILGAQATDSVFESCAAAALSGSTAACPYSGVAVWLDLVVTGGGRELHSLKSVVFSPVNPPGRAPNTNPTLDGVRTGAGVLATPDLAFTAGEAVRLQPTWPPTAHDLIVLPTFSGGTVAMEEQFSLTYLADAGSFDPFQTTEAQSGGLLGASTQPPDLSSTWTAPASGGPAAARLWFVVTDGRGGVAWLLVTAHPR
jgi:hypothetical protein